MAEGQVINIDGKSYEIDQLTNEAKSQLGNIRAVDSEVQRLERQMAIAKTARNAYARALHEELAKVEPQQ
tara:strand:+ start:801 stop:1010 length:210 start_codon:yes stop_codon:yes gene_type:complete